MLPSVQLRSALQAVTNLQQPPTVVPEITSEAELFNRIGVLRAYLAARRTRLHALPEKFPVVVQAPLRLSDGSNPLADDTDATLQILTVRTGIIHVGKCNVVLPNSVASELPLPFALAMLVPASKAHLLKVMRQTLSACFVHNPALLIWTLQDINYEQSQARASWNDRARTAKKQLYCATNGDAFNRNSAMGSALARALPTWIYDRLNEEST